MEFKAVIFDLDGTLLDTLDDIADAANNMLSKRNFPTHPIEDYKYFIGDGIGTLVRRIVPEHQITDELANECMMSVREEYSLNWNNKTKVYDGIIELLYELQKLPLKLAVLTNKPDDFAQLSINEFLPEGRFDIVMGLREGVPKKPDPTGALKIAKIFQVEPSQILYIGDTSTDMKTATAASMYAMGVLWGFRTKDELVEHGARICVEHPSQISQFLLSNKK